MTKAERSAEMKRRRKVADKNRKAATNQPITKDSTDDATHEREIAFAFGYCRCWLDSYADRVGVARSALAGRVGQLLQHSAGR